MVRLFLVALSCCTLIASANTASAGWGHLRGGGSSGGYGSYGSSGGDYAVSYGSSGGYGSYGADYGGSSGGSTGGYYGGSSGGSAGGSSGGGGHRVGLFRRIAAHIHAKHARRASYGSSGYGSSGGYYSAGYGSSGGYATSYGSSGYGSSGGAVSYGSSGGGYGSTGYGSSYGGNGGVVVPYEGGYLGVSNQSPASAASLASHQTESSDAVYLNVNVPPAAKVFVNETPTSTVGASRQFVSRGLQAGKKYKFVVRAELVGADGQVASEEKTVTLTAGQRDELSFASLDQTPVQTAVTLNVPAEAKVILAGNPTSASGQTRTFRTAQLKAGDRWDDYVVEVQYNGKVKRETLRLVAGDDVALTFNFDDDKSLVASR
jgi:uncharacterized protein (TIGR03000 family)